MPKISNHDVRPFIQRRELFNTNSGAISARQYGNLYAVFSYGDHFPMFVYDNIASQWFGNHDKYSRTTARHQQLARPISDGRDDPDDIRAVSINWCSTDYLQSLITAGSYVAQCAERIIKEAA